MDKQQKIGLIIFTLGIVTSIYVWSTPRPNDILVIGVVGGVVTAALGLAIALDFVDEVKF